MRKRDLMWIRSGNSGGGRDTLCDLIENGLENGVLYCETAESVKENVFEGSTKIKKVVLPNVKVVNRYAFSECLYIDEVNLPSVEFIDKQAFFGCGDSIKELIVKIPNVKKIEANAFAQCYKLKKISLPNIEETIGLAFDNCNNLEKVIIGNASARLGAYSFYCPALSAIVLTDEENFITDAAAFLYAFGPDGKNPLLNGTCFIYVPSNMYSIYEEMCVANGASDLLAMFRKIEDYPEICE